jgi:hypothetical protein
VAKKTAKKVAKKVAKKAQVKHAKIATKRNKNLSIIYLEPLFPSMKYSKNKITRKRRTSKKYGGYVISNDAVNRTSKSKSIKKVKNKFYVIIFYNHINPKNNKNTDR